MLSQTNQLKQLMQKYEAIELKNSILTAFANSDICTCQLNNSPPAPLINPNTANLNSLKFNSTITNGTQSMDIKKLYSGCGLSSPLIAEADKKLPGTQSGLVVQSVKVMNLKPTGATNVWQGDLQIDLKSSSLIMNIHPVKAQLSLTVNPSSPGSTRITSCSTDGSSSTTNSNLLQSNVRKETNAVTAYRWAEAIATCNSDEVVTGGGGRCTSNDTLGYNFIYRNEPQGNGWRIKCDTPIAHNNTATVYALCAKKTN